MRTAIAAIVTGATLALTGASVATASTTAPAISSARWHRSVQCWDSTIPVRCTVERRIKHLDKLRIHATQGRGQPYDLVWTAKCDKTGHKTKTKKSGWVSQGLATARTVTHNYEHSDNSCLVKVTFESGVGAGTIHGWVTFTRNTN